MWVKIYEGKRCTGKEGTEMQVTHTHVSKTTSMGHHSHEDHLSVHSKGPQLHKNGEFRAWVRDLSSLGYIFDWALQQVQNYISYILKVLLLSRECPRTLQPVIGNAHDYASRNNFELYAHVLAPTQACCLCIKTHILCTINLWRCEHMGNGVMHTVSHSPLNSLFPWIPALPSLFSPIQAAAPQSHTGDSLFSHP